MRNVYEQILKEVYNDTIVMASLVENTITQTLKAISKGGYELAEVIKGNDDIIDEEQEEIESSILVGDIMQTDVRTVAPDTLLREAAEILYRNKYGCLPVLDGDNKLVGIITEADFLRLAIALLHDA